MKKMLLGLIIVLSLSGCVADKVYTAGKVVYQDAKTIYVALPIENEKLEKLDEILVSVDTARTAVVDKKKGDAVILELQDSF